MPFPTGTKYDVLRTEIEWLLKTLADKARYPMLAQHVQPRLQADLDKNLARWVSRDLGYLAPPMVLSVKRWRSRKAAPEVLLDRLEKGLQFNAGNKSEVGNLTGNFWDPQLAATIIMQLMVTATLLGRTAPGALQPVTANRPDLWVKLDGRDIGIEVTSRNPHADLSKLIGTMTVDWQEAKEDFADLWNGPVKSKAADYDGSFPIILVLWDCDYLKDVHSFVTEEHLTGTKRTFYDLIKINKANCSPFSAILYLPYVEEPHLVFCDGMSSGKPFTSNEVAALRKLFEINPAADNGFLPPGMLS